MPVDSQVGREHDIHIEHAIMNTVKPIPDGVPVVMPMLVCRDVRRQLTSARPRLVPWSWCADRVRMGPWHMRP